jgi:hypothetical protein
MRRIKNNVASLGDALLYHYFLPYKNERREGKTQIHIEEADLQKIDFDGQHVNSLILWGTATGLRKIEIPKEKTGSALDFISREIKTEEELVKFSHFIVKKGWCSKPPYVYSDITTVDVYRLTQSNKNLITVNWS